MAHAAITLPFPLAGTIHDEAWKRPPGNHDFQLTNNAAQHVAQGGVRANDFGNALGDHPGIASILAGKVVEHRAGDGVTTVLSPDGWRIVYAHMAIDAAFAAHPIGAFVALGAIMGHVSNTYPPSRVLPIHLHIQVGYKVTNNIGWLDPWPLFAFNQYAVMSGPGNNIRLAPSTSAPIYATTKLDGIYRNGARIAPLGTPMRVQQPSFAVGSGLVWVKALLGSQVVYIWRNLVHFDIL